MTASRPSPPRGIRRPLRFRWIVTSVVVGLTLLLVLAWYLAPPSMSPRGPPPPSGPPTGPYPFELGNPTPQLNGSSHEYWMQVVPSDGLTVGDLRFQIWDSRGQNASIPGSLVRVVETPRCLVATFSIAAQTWSAAPITAANACDPPGSASTPMTSGMWLDVNTGAESLTGLGDRFVATLSSGGSVYVSIP